MKKKLKVIIPAILVFALFMFLGMQYLLHASDKVLVKFVITEVSYSSTDFKINFESVKAAKKYVITISDVNNRKVYERETKTNENKISLTNLEYGMKYSVMVYAYDKYGDSRPCEKDYTFKWDEPTFDKEASILLKNEDYELNITGEYKKEFTYKIRVEENGQVLEEKEVKDYTYTIDSKYYKDKETMITVSLLKDKDIVCSKNLYNNMNPISDVKIQTPLTDIEVPYNDIPLTFEGGDNALEYTINVYNGTKLTKTSTTSKHSVIFSKRLFGPTMTYRLEVVAKYEDYSKSDSVTVTIAEKEQLKPVYISKNWKHVRKGTKITLGCPDPDAKIYYTLNGDNPESMGTLYTEPIEITEDVTINAIAMSDNKNSSIVTTYDISCSNKDTLKIYLSPSNQGGNPGVASTGYTNERDEMNDLTDYIQERLLSVKGVEIMRNTPAGNINLWNQESNYFGADFKIAIHSNASGDHKSRGIETWIYAENSATYSIANMIQSGLWTIYPYNDEEALNRGVKYANGALGEANDLYAPFQLLVEVAHHDDALDAAWIMENKKLIGYNIADSILRYYGFIE